MDLHCVHSRSTLKIRRAPSCKISSSSSSSQTPSSFHGSCCRKQLKKKGCNSITVLRQPPLIFHTFDPEVIVTEPAEFMSVVQRLTGSLHTRRLLRASMREWKEMQLSLGMENVEIKQKGKHLMQQSKKDPLKEGATIILAPAFIEDHVCTANDLLPAAGSPSCPNDSINRSPELPLLGSSHANQLIINKENPPLSPAACSSDLINLNTCSHPAAPFKSSDTNQLQNHPSLSLSSNSSDNPLSSSSSPAAILSMISKESSQLLLPFSSCCCLQNPKKTSSSSRLHINPKKTPFYSSSSSCTDLHDKQLQPSCNLPLPSTPNLKANYCKPLIIDNNQMSLQSTNNVSNCGHTMSKPLPAKARGDAYEWSPWSPVSPNSSLTTISSEGYHTDNNISTEDGASTYREASSCNNNIIHDQVEDGSINFFVFSGDSYYGNYDYDAAVEDFQFVLDYSHFNTIF